MSNLPDTLEELRRFPIKFESSNEIFDFYKIIKTLGDDIEECHAYDDVYFYNAGGWHVGIVSSTLYKNIKHVLLFELRLKKLERIIEDE